MQFLDSLVEIWAAYYDTLALFIICYLATRLRSVVAFVVLMEFTLVYFGQNWFKSLELWGSLGLNYHYALGIKDTLMALSLFILAASPWLTLAYITPSLLCWGLWWAYLAADKTLLINLSLFDYVIFNKVLITYDQWLQLYYTWSPLYALTMLLQINGLRFGNTNTGKRFRNRAVPINWDRLLQPFYRLAYARITINHSKITEPT